MTAAPAFNCYLDKGRDGRRIIWFECANAAASKVMETWCTRSKFTRTDFPQIAVSCQQTALGGPAAAVFAQMLVAHHRARLAVIRALPRPPGVETTAPGDAPGFTMKRLNDVGVVILATQA